VIEIMRFRLAPGADQSAFLAADRRVQTEFAYQQAGLLRRTTAHDGDGGWIVIDLWRHAADAAACDAAWGQEPVTAEFMALVDPATIQTERYQDLD
jgi:hypothetical protein